MVPLRSVFNYIGTVRVMEPGPFFVSFVVLELARHFKPTCIALDANGNSGGRDALRPSRGDTASMV